MALSSPKNDPLAQSMSLQVFKLNQSIPQRRNHA
jgi:hypothetical protein